MKVTDRVLNKSTSTILRNVYSDDSLNLDGCSTFFLIFFTAQEKMRLNVLAVVYTFVHHGSPLFAILRTAGHLSF